VTGLRAHLEAGHLPERLLAMKTPVETAPRMVRVVVNWMREVAAAGGQ
jgi:hypothetical protein